MPYVDRDLDGAITGEYRASQRPDHEWVDEAAPEWRARELASLKVLRRLEVDTMRDRRAARGVAVTLSGGRSFTVQTRDADDKLNLLGMGTLIELLVAQAGPSATIGFRDAANAVRPLTQADVLALLAQVGAAQQALIAAGWDHKDAIEALTTIETVAAYDIGAGWPA